MINTVYRKMNKFVTLSPKRMLVSIVFFVVVIYFVSYKSSRSLIALRDESAAKKTRSACSAYETLTDNDNNVMNHVKNDVIHYLKNDVNTEANEDVNNEVISDVNNEKDNYANNGISSRLFKENNGINNEIGRNAADNDVINDVNNNVVDKPKSVKRIEENDVNNDRNIPLPEREWLYKERNRDIINGCKKVNRAIKEHSILDKSANLRFENKHFIYFCFIQKVGMKFWLRVLTVMGSQGRLTSPFQIGLNGTVKLPKWSTLSKNERKRFEEQAISFMFVRDPYARLFSGYLNKLYHPDLRYWKMTGREVVKHIRRVDNDVYQTYGFDVTFPEFIKYILLLHETGQPIDGHFAPMARQCDPCSTHFQYIGKLETMKDDATYLISKWRNEFKDITFHFDDFEKENIMDIAALHVRFLFKTKGILNEIKFPFIDLMLRTWRDLQMRGYLWKDINFPYRKTDAETVTEQDYVEAIRNTLNVPVNQTEVKLQRDESLVQAYRLIPIEDMERLRRFLQEDCLLFGYDDRPQALFDRSQPVNEDFLYLKSLNAEIG